MVPVFSGAKAGDEKMGGCRKGFTLVEVLVAVVIFAVSAAALMQAMSVSLSTFHQAQKVFDKAALEPTIMETLLLEGKEKGEIEGIQWTSQEEHVAWDWDDLDRVRKLSVFVEGPKVHATMVLYHPLWFKNSH